MISHSGKVVILRFWACGGSSRTRAASAVQQDKKFSRSRLLEIVRSCVGQSH